MKPIFENIDVAIDSSFKIETYQHSKTCSLMGWHIHPEYELVYIKNGSGTLQINHKTIPYTNGTLLFIGPNIPHADFGNKEFPDNYEVVIQFGKEFLEQKLSLFPEFKAVRQLILTAKHGLVFPDAIKEQLAHNFEGFTKADNSKNLINLLDILRELTLHTQKAKVIDPSFYIPNSSEDVNRLEFIFDYIHQHLHQQITTTQIAKEVGLTPNSLSRFFTKLTHKSLIQFVNECRIRKAAELLQDQPYAITEVMYQCGFTDASYFTKLFKKQMGFTPTQFRKKAS